MIDDNPILQGLLSGYFGDRLAKLVRPRKTSEFDVIPIDELRKRNNWIDVAANFILAGGFLLLFAVNLILGLNGNLWRVGFWFCFPVTLAFIFFAIATLPKGLRRYREFWRFHELKHRIHRALSLCLFVPLALLGLVSAIKLV